MNDHSQHNHDPVPASGAVIFDGEKVLLVRRGKPPRKGEWSLPGGRIQENETPEDAAQRELMEETGISVSSLNFIETLDVVSSESDADGAPFHYLIHDFWGEVDGAFPHAASDVTDAVMVPLAEIERYDLWQETVRIIHKAENMRRNAQQPTQHKAKRHTVSGHLRMVGIAVFFGLGAYAVLWVLMAILRTIGFQTF